MNTMKIPTSADIYLEADGKKVAVVQSYQARASRSGRLIESFGEAEPVAAIAGNKGYQIELSRLYATDLAIADGVDFYTLENFSLVICKPDRSIVYDGCQWSNIDEQAEVGGMVLEKVTVLSPHRVEIRKGLTDSGLTGGLASGGLTACKR